MEAAIDEHTVAIAQKPQDEELWVRRGMALVRAGRFAEALADLDKGLKTRANISWRFRRGCLRLYLGDHKGYLDDCQQMFASPIHDKDRQYSNQACKLCMLQPGAVADLEPIASTIDALVGDSNPWDLLNKTMVEYRLGHYDAVQEWNDRVQKSTLGVWRLTGDLLAAMAHYKVGRFGKGIDLLAATTGAFDRSGPRPGHGDIGGGENWLIFQILRREAETLMSY